jgi:aflatoxin B1 aldehyde reductase
MTHSPAKVIFGGGVFVTSSDEFSKPENIAEVLDAIEKHGITTIDTANAYAQCEQLLGQENATTRFTVDTKYPGGMSPKPSTKEVVVASGMESLQALNTKSVRIYCLRRSFERNSCVSWKASLTN